MSLGIILMFATINHVLASKINLVPIFHFSEDLDMNNDCSEPPPIHYLVVNLLSYCILMELTFYSIYNTKVGL